jgi:uncharacterized membrane protein
MTVRSSQTSVVARLRAGRVPALVLAGGWIAVVALTLLVDAALGRRFLDLPLSALVASQGALFACALVAVRVSSLDKVADDL